MSRQPWEIDLILWFQSLGDWLEPMMDFFTKLGYPITYAFFMSILYWCVDSKLGRRFALFALFTGAINIIFKQLAHAPRPYWVDSRIRPLGDAPTGFGFPSGHAQTATIWIFIGDFIKTWWGWGLAFFLVMMIGLSRIYLGAHFPSQVLTGWVIGALLMIAFLRLERPVINWIKTKSLGNQLLIVFALTLLFLLAGWMSVNSLNDWQIPELWSQNVTPHLTEGKTFEPVDGDGILLGGASLLGMLVGTILIAHFGGHHTGGSLLQRALRLPVGLICIGVIFGGASTLGNMLTTEEEQGLLFWTSQFLTTFLLYFSIFFAAPLLFRRLGLTKEPT